MSSICCYDLSHYENPGSFHDAYEAGYILAIVKATQGVGGTDPCFRPFVQRLSTIDGQLIGAYHFGTDDDPDQQAAHFLEIAGHVPLLVLDYEPNGDHTMSRAQAEAFVTHVHGATGKWPLLYGGSILKDNPVAPGSPLLNCELWLSQYGPNPVLPQGWSSYRLWQFTDGSVGPTPHSVPGVGQCDISRFPGSQSDMRRWYASL